MGRLCQRIWRYCRGEPGFYFALFIAIWMAAWVANGLKLSVFDLDRLRDLFFFVFGKYLADSGLNSAWQKPIKGEMEHETRNTQ